MSFVKRSKRNGQGSGVSPHALPGELPPYGMRSSVEVPCWPPTPSNEDPTDAAVNNALYINYKSIVRTRTIFKVVKHIFLILNC